MEVTASLQVQTVRLDSMSLFDVGQARLKDGSTKVLVDALVNIRAKPGWLILVAGYTDATGDEKQSAVIAAACRSGAQLDAADQRHPGDLFCRTGAGRASLRRPTTRHRAGQSTGASKSVLFRVLTPVRT